MEALNPWWGVAAVCAGQGVRFYLQTSIWTYQKGLFGCLFLHAFFRALGSGPGFFGTLAQQLPVMLLFLAAHSFLLMNWAQMFQSHFEKKGFKRLFRSSDGFAWFRWIARTWNAASVTMLVWAASLGTDGVFVPTTMGPFWTHFGVFATVLGLGFLWGFLWLSTQPRFVFRTLTSHSTNLHSISTLLAVTSVSQVIYLGIWSTGGSSQALSVWEFTHCLLFLVWLRDSDLAVLRLPTGTKQLTHKWLTSMLQEHGTIPGNVKVSEFSGGSRPKGCHFQVSRVSVSYNRELATKTPRSFIVKILTWDKPVLERVQLQARRLFDFDSIESMYLKSYQIEHRFYRHVAPRCSGLKLPTIYYNFEDCFNNQFGMVLEDLSDLEDGQPWGFNFEECCICLRRLAQFHANNWNRRLWSSKIKKWSIGGYWTGLKREANKREVREAWRKMQKNFAADLPELSSEPLADLGDRLFGQLDLIMNRFETMQPVTLLHGDFKLSNLFIGRQKNSARRKPDMATADNGAIPDDDGTKLFAIDWQWLGLGSCAIDVFYFIVSSTEAPVLRRQKDLMHVYHDELQSHLQSEADYPFEHFERDLETCFVDFCSYAIVSKWGRMENGAADLEKYQRKSKDGMHLRTLDHVQHIIRYSDVFLKKIESMDSSSRKRD
jgi:Ecdysteroid kinase-like family